MLHSELYRVTVWDKQANNPYYILDYEGIEDAQKVARSMKKHYVEEIENSPYEVKLQRMEGTHDV